MKFSTEKLGDWAQPYILRFSDVKYYWPAERLHGFIDLAVRFLLPLLHFLYTFTRFIIIRHPSLISTYCTRAKTWLFIGLATFFSAIVSFHELFDISVGSIENVIAVSERKQANETGFHEDFTGYVVMLTFVLSFLPIMIFSCTLTKEMNTSIMNNVVFLRALGNRERYKYRITGYTRLIRLNRALCLATLLSALTSASKTMFGEFVRYFFHFKGHLHDNIGLAWARSSVEIVVSLEVILHPIFLLLFMSSIQEPIKRVKSCYRWATRPDDTRSSDDEGHPTEVTRDEGVETHFQRVITDSRCDAVFDSLGVPTLSGETRTL